MTENTYTEQYKDPRWQKVRLRVLERDNWKCQKCYDTDSTLHVHHLYYEDGKPVWDYPLICFVTLCETCHEEDMDLESAERINLKDVRRMEWQANFFASCLLLPKDQFTREFLKQVVRHNLSDRGFGLLYLDGQRCNIDTYHSVTYPLMKEYAVSRSVVKLRLMKLGFLNEAQIMPNLATSADA